MMKKKRRGRVLLAAVILMLLASCRITDVSEGERKELSYAIVKPGDTRWDIAKKFYTTTDKIRELNELKTETLTPMQQLLVERV